MADPVNQEIAKSALEEIKNLRLVAPAPFVEIDSEGKLQLWNIIHAFTAERTLKVQSGTSAIALENAGWQITEIRSPQLNANRQRSTIPENH